MQNFFLAQNGVPAAQNPFESPQKKESVASDSPAKESVASGSDHAGGSSLTGHQLQTRYMEMLVREGRGKNAKEQLGIIDAFHTTPEKDKSAL